MKQVYNPYLPSFEYVPDGEPRVFEDRLYVFGSHDRYGADDFCLNDYVTWSAPLDDLSDWRYEGVIYRADQDPENPKRKAHMNAPDCVQGPDGRYYLYYNLHDKSFTSVAVANKPQGPYEFYGHVHYPDGKKFGTVKGDPYNFNPGVLVDGDKVFLYTGFAPNREFPAAFALFMKMSFGLCDDGYGVELESDMLTVKGNFVSTVPGWKNAEGTLFEGHGFYEASSPRKIGNTYYLIYSSELSHELCYATAEKPLGPFTYGGTIVSIGDIGLRGIQGKADAANYTGNTHGGLVSVNGQWYVFYHRQTNQKKCNRQGCAEKVTILADGSIPQVEVTSCGLNAGPLTGTGTYPAHIACNLWCKEDSFDYGAFTKGDHFGHPYFTQEGGDIDAGEVLPVATASQEGNSDEKAAKACTQHIANMMDGAVAGFKYFDFEKAAPHRIALKLRGQADGIMEVFSDAACENRLAGIPVLSVAAGATAGSKASSGKASSGNASDGNASDGKASGVKADNPDWEYYDGEFSSPVGVSPLYFRYSGKGAVDFSSFTLE